MRSIAKKKAGEGAAPKHVLVAIAAGALLGAGLLNPAAALAAPASSAASSAVVVTLGPAAKPPVVDPAPAAKRTVFVFNCTGKQYPGLRLVNAKGTLNAAYEGESRSMTQISTNGGNITWTGNSTKGRNLLVTFTGTFTSYSVAGSGDCLREVR